MLFVAKVLYLLEPDSGDKQGEIQEDVEEQEALGHGVAREEREHEARAPEEVESDREEINEGKEERSKPATLLWLVQKLSRIAKLEASYSPRNPLKVRITCCDWKHNFIYFWKHLFLESILVVLVILPSS